MKLTPFFAIVFLLSFSTPILSQKITRMEPPNWWVGMKNTEVQLLVYGNKVSDFHPFIDYPNVRIEQVIKVQNPNYLFINLKVSEEAQAGTVKIQFSKNGKVKETYDWPLWQREKNATEQKGFDNSDVLYLITPDRFANGDVKNDELKGLQEKLNRDIKGGRHGGDIKGILQHLDYIKEMGFSAIWLNPLLENDMKEYSYHGYSTTDFYKVDARFGTNEDYRQLAKAADEKGIKLIMDMIVNHCGLDHWWMKDPPMEDWINTWPTYTQTNHRKSVLQDPYVSELDKKIFTDGWFVPTMPDLNQRNPFMATYLTQNGIWWVEYLGLAGIRMDTYPYPDMDYMTEWTQKIMEEYPNFNIVGEEWYQIPTIVAYWQQDKENPNGYTSSLKSLMDFPVQVTMVEALVAEETWSGGWIDLYEMIAQDFVYANPYDLVVFPDNHDMSRIFTQVNEDYGLFQLAIAFVMTTRGIPQIYYGTEILMDNSGTTDHGIIRSDFPGGWAGDKVNAFTGKGLTDRQKDAQNFLKKLLHWRQKMPAVHHGKMLHFIPEGGVYVYFRYNDDQKVMVILNKNTTTTHLELDRFKEMLDGVSEGTDVLSGKTYKMKQTIELPDKAPLILELR